MYHVTELSDAEPIALSRLLDLASTKSNSINELWTEDDYEGIYKHLLKSPIFITQNTDNEDCDESNLAQPRELNGQIVDFEQALFSNQPSQKIITQIKEYAKREYSGNTFGLPPRVLLALYYLAIAVSVNTWGLRPTSLDDAQLATGFDWAASQKWVDSTSHKILKLAHKNLSIH